MTSETKEPINWLAAIGGAFILLVIAYALFDEIKKSIFGRTLAEDIGNLVLMVVFGIVFSIVYYFFMSYAFIIPFFVIVCAIAYWLVDKYKLGKTKGGS